MYVVDVLTYANACVRRGSRALGASSPLASSSFQVMATSARHNRQEFFGLARNFLERADMVRFGFGACPCFIMCIIFLGNLNGFVLVGVLLSCSFDRDVGVEPTLEGNPC